MSWRKVRARGEIVTRPAGMLLPQLLLSRGSRHNVKLRLLRAAYLKIDAVHAV